MVLENKELYGIIVRFWLHPPVDKVLKFLQGLYLLLLCGFHQILDVKHTNNTVSRINQEITAEIHCIIITYLASPSFFSTLPNMRFT